MTGLDPFHRKATEGAADRREHARTRAVDALRCLDDIDRLLPPLPDPTIP